MLRLLFVIFWRYKQEGEDDPETWVHRIITSTDRTENRTRRAGRWRETNPLTPSSPSSTITQHTCKTMKHTCITDDNVLEEIRVGHDGTTRRIVGSREGFQIVRSGSMRHEKRCPLRRGRVRERSLLQSTNGVVFVIGLCRYREGRKLWSPKHRISEQELIAFRRKEERFYIDCQIDRDPDGNSLCTQLKTRKRLTSTTDVHHHDRQKRVAPLPNSRNPSGTKQIEPIDILYSSSTPSRYRNAAKNSHGSCPSGPYL